MRIDLASEGLCSLVGLPPELLALAPAPMACLLTSRATETRSDDPCVERTDDRSTRSDGGWEMDQGERARLERLIGERDVRRATPARNGDAPDEKDGVASKRFAVPVLGTLTLYHG